MIEKKNPEENPKKPGLSKPLIKKLAKAHSDKKAAQNARGPRMNADKKAVIDAEVPESEREIPVDFEDIGKDLTPRQARFVSNYVLNDHLRGNATFAYAEAYGIDLNSFPCNDCEYDPETHKQTKKSSYQKAHHSCSVNASKLLINTDIQSVVRKLKASLLKAEYLDCKLVDVIERGDFQHVVAAVREGNRVLGRGQDTVKHEWIPNLPSVVQIQVIQPANAGIDANETPSRTQDGPGIP